MDKEHILKLLDWIYNEVISAGGDGDFLWYSKHYTIEEILPLVQEYNNSKPFKWIIVVENKNIFWGQEQEWIIITNHENMYSSAPSWQQGLLKY